MTCFVDDMEAALGPMKMFHLIADSDAELHTMADSICVACKLHQAPQTLDSHYNIALSKKPIARGAVSITWRECGAMKCAGA